MDRVAGGACDDFGVRIPFLRSEPPAGAPRARVLRNAAGRQVGVYEYGDPDGAPLFALHGTPACGAGFDWTDGPARARGLRVIAPDRPGIGWSDPVTLTSVAAYAPELEALADELGFDRFSVLGYSGGGPYALAAAYGLADRVETVTIVAGAGEIGAWAEMRDLARSDRQVTWLALHARPLASVVMRAADVGARAFPRLALQSAATEMSARDRTVLRALGTARESMAPFRLALAHGPRGVVDDYALLARPWRFRLGDIARPVQVWHGTDDTLVPLAHSEALVARLPDASLTVWPGEGHLALITHVDEVLDDVAARIG